MPNVIIPKLSNALKNLKNGRAGLTAIEMLVTLSIITIVSVSVLLNFSGVSEGAALNRSAQELALGIRQAQNMALAIRQAQIQQWPTDSDCIRIIRRVGIQINKSGLQANKFFLFADMDNPEPGCPIGSANNKYDVVITGPVSAHRNERVVNSDVIFARGIVANRFLNCDGTVGPCSFSGSNQDTVNIIFLAPESTVRITNQPPGAAAGITVVVSEITIELITPSGQTKTVVVRTNGQISIK